MTIFIDKIYLFEGGGIWCFPFTEREESCPSSEAPRCINSPVVCTLPACWNIDSLCENEHHPPSYIHIGTV